MEEGKEGEEGRTQRRGGALATNTTDSRRGGVPETSQSELRREACWLEHPLRPAGEEPSCQQRKAKATASTFDLQTK